jgi:hypothetical protein
MPRVMTVDDVQRALRRMAHEIQRYFTKGTLLGGVKE